MNYFLLLAGINSSSDETAEGLDKDKFVNELRNLLFNILAQKYKVLLSQSGIFISGEILGHFQKNKVFHESSVISN